MRRSLAMHYLVGRPGDASEVHSPRLAVHEHIIPLAVKPASVRRLRELDVLAPREGNRELNR